MMLQGDEKRSARAVRWLLAVVFASTCYAFERPCEVRLRTWSAEGAAERGRFEVMDARRVHAFLVPTDSWIRPRCDAAFTYQGVMLDSKRSLRGVALPISSRTVVNIVRADEEADPNSLIRISGSLNAPRPKASCWVRFVHLIGIGGGEKNAFAISSAGHFEAALPSAGKYLALLYCGGDYAGYEVVTVSRDGVRSEAGAGVGSLFSLRVTDEGSRECSIRVVLHSWRSEIPEYSISSVDGRNSGMSRHSENMQSMAAKCSCGVHTIEVSPKDKGYSTYRFQLRVSTPDQVFVISRPFFAPRSQVSIGLHFRKGVIEGPSPRAPDRWLRFLAYHGSVDDDILGVLVDNAGQFDVGLVPGTEYLAVTYDGSTVRAVEPVSGDDFQPLRLRGASHSDHPR